MLKLASELTNAIFRISCGERFVLKDTTCKDLKTFVINDTITTCHTLAIKKQLMHENFYK